MKSDKSHIDLAQFKKTPLQVPDGYFIELEKNILQQTSEEPRIPSSFTKHNPFEVEDDYFEGLRAEIQSKIEEQNTKSKKSKIYPLYWSAAAAMIVGLVFWFRPAKIESFENVSQSTIAEYLVDEEEFNPVTDDVLALGTTDFADYNLNSEPISRITNTTAVDELNEITE